MAFSMFPRSQYLTYDPWILLKVTSMASTASNRKSAKNCAFLMIHSTLTENMIDHFGARVDGNFKFSKILIK